MNLEPCYFSMHKNIAGFPLYSVTSMGEVRSLVRNKAIVPSLSHVGYLSVRVCKDNSHTQQRFLLSRLVLSSFLGFDKDNPIAEHNDDVRRNNALTNLKWSTQSKNIQKSYDSGRSKSPKAMTGKSGAKHHRSKPIAGYDSNGNEAIRFESISLAREAGYCVSSVLYGHSKTCKGLTFKYI